MARSIYRTAIALLVAVCAILLYTGTREAWLPELPGSLCADAFAQGEPSALCTELGNWYARVTSLYQQLGAKHNAANAATEDCSTPGARQTVRTLFSQAAALFEDVLGEVEACAEAFATIPGLVSVIEDTARQTSVMCADYQTGVEYLIEMTYAFAEEDIPQGMALGETGATYCNQAMTVSDVLAVTYETISTAVCQKPSTEVGGDTSLQDARPAIQLVSPAMGAMVEGWPVPFEWLPTDPAADVSSYTLTIQQLPESVVDQISVGGEIESFFDVEYEITIPGIGDASAEATDYEIELQPGASYAWQVFSFLDGEEIGQSDVGFFTYGTEPSDSVTTVEPFVIGVDLDMVPVDPLNPQPANPLINQVQAELKKKMPLPLPGTCGEVDFDGGIYRVTYEYDDCIVARGETLAGGWETTFIFTFKRTTFFKWRSKGPCAEPPGHSGGHKPWTWSDWDYDDVVGLVMDWKVIGGCPTAISSSYYKRWLYEFGKADMAANGLDQLGVASFFGDVGRIGQLCRAALAVPCPGGAKKPVNVMANLQQAPARQPLAPGVAGVAGGAAMGFGVVDGMDGIKIGFNVYRQDEQWLIDVFGLQGAIPVEPGSQPPYPMVHVLISYNDPIQECNTNSSGEFRRDGTVLTDFDLPFFIDVRYQNPKTAVWSRFTRIELPTVGSVIGFGTASGMNCAQISYTVYRLAGVDRIWIYGKDGAIPPAATGQPAPRVRVDIPDNAPIWIENVDHLGAFLYEAPLQSVPQPFSIAVTYWDGANNPVAPPCQIP